MKYGIQKRKNRREKKLPRFPISTENLRALPGNNRGNFCNLYISFNTNHLVYNHARTFLLPSQQSIVTIKTDIRKISIHKSIRDNGLFLSSVQDNLSVVLCSTEQIRRIQRN